MKKNFFLSVLILLSGLLYGNVKLPFANAVTPGNIPAPPKTSLISDKNTMLHSVFIKNQGQIKDKEILYFAYVKGGKAYFKKDRFGFVFTSNGKQCRYEVSYKGRLNAKEPLSTVFNFIKPEKRVFNVKCFKKLYATSKDYDISFYFKNGRLEYDLILKTDKEIKLKYSLYGGKLKAEGDKLKIEWPWGFAVETIPYSFNEKKEKVDVEYLVKNNVVSFASKKKCIVIDPATYVGGSGEEILYGVEKVGNDFWFTGRINSPNILSGTATTVGSCDGMDIIVGCFSGSPTNNPKFITIIGGSDTEEGFLINYDSQGSVFVAGYTRSADFPTASNNAFQPTKKAYEDCVILKFDLNGNYIAMTFFGGKYNERVFGIEFLNGKLVMSAPTWSPDFPTTPGVVQPVYGGYCDEVIAVFDKDLTTLERCTYIGGSSIEYLYGFQCVEYNTGNSIERRILVAGMSYSQNYPLVNPIQSSNGGGFDMVFTSLTEDLSQITFSTYLGGSGDEYYGGLRAPAITSDSGAGLGTAPPHFMLIGETFSSDFPVTANAFQSNYGGNGDVFFVEYFEDSLDNFTLGYSTYLGGSEEDMGFRIGLVENEQPGNSQCSGCASIVLTGYTSSPDFPVTRCCYDDTHNGGQDIFAMLFIDENNKAPTLSYSTFIGSSNNEGGEDVVAWKDGEDIWGCFVGKIDGDGFPEVDGQFQETFAGQTDGLVVALPLRRHRTDVSVSKEVLNGTSYYAGDPVVFRILVTNNGNEEACDVVLHDNVDSRLENPEYSLDSGQTWNSWPGTYTIGEMMPGDSVELLIRASINSNVPENTSISNTAWIDEYSLDPDMNNNSATAQINIVCANYVISVIVDNGTTPENQVVVCDPRGCTTVYFYPNDGYHLGQLIIDGKPHCFSPNQTAYTFCDLDGDHEVHAIFVEEQKPVITAFTATPTSGLKPLDVVFKCEAYDPDGGDITKYLWDFDNDGVIDRETLTGDSVQTVYPDSGVFYATVKVVDDEGEVSESGKIKIKVGRKNPVCYSPGFFSDYFNTRESDYLCVINDNGLDSNLTISYFDENGQMLKQVDYVLKSFNKLCFSSENCSDKKVKVIKIEGDQELTYLWRVDSEKDSAMFMPGKNPGNRIFLPHIAEESVWSNIIGVSNPYGSKVYINEDYVSDSLFISKFVSDEKIVNFPSFWFEVTAPDPTPFDDDNALSGFVCYKRNDSKFSIVSDSKVFTHGYLAHIPTESSMFWYGYVLTNVDSKDVKVNLKFFDGEGNILGEKVLKVNQGEKLKGLLGNDFPEFTGKASWMEIVSDGLVSAQSVYGAVNNETGGGGICALSASVKSGTTLILPDAFEDNFWTGISLVNVSNEKALLSIKLIEDDGQVVETRNVELNAFSQFKDTLSSIFTKKTINGYILIESTQPIIGVMIKGNGDNSEMLGVTGKVY